MHDFSIYSIQLSLPMDLWPSDLPHMEPSDLSYMEPPPGGFNIDLWPAHSWDEEELKQFTSALGTLGPATGQRSSGARGLELQIILTVAAGAVAAGFLNALGSDLYLGLRKKLVDLLYTKKRDLSGLTDKSRVEPPEEVFGFLKVVLPAAPHNVDFECAYADENDLSAFFREAGTIQSALSSDLAKAPHLRELINSVTVHATATKNAMDWSILIFMESTERYPDFTAALYAGLDGLLKQTLLAILHAQARDDRGSPDLSGVDVRRTTSLTIFWPLFRLDCSFANEEDLTVFFREIGRIYARLSSELAEVQEHFSDMPGLVSVRATSTGTGLTWLLRWRGEELPFMPQDLQPNE